MLPFPMGPNQIWIVYLDQEEIWEGRDESFFLDGIPRHAHKEALAPSRRDKRRERILSRALTYSALSAALNVGPDGVRLSVEDHGKPVAAEDAHGRAPAFNLSHSGGLMALALGPSGRIGIDIENRHRRVNLEVAKRFFSPREQSQLDAVPPSHRSHLFLKFWTLKEAYVKALGSGIAGQELTGFGFDLVHSRFHAPSSGEGVSEGRTGGAGEMDAPEQSWRFCHGPFKKNSYMALALDREGDRPEIQIYKWLGDAFIPKERWEYDLIPG